MFSGNQHEFGGSFDDILDERLSAATSVKIATGYVGKETFLKHQDRLIEIAQNGGTSKVLVGMAYYQGLSETSYATLRQLNAKLQSISESNGIFVTYARPYHGKIYLFTTGEEVEAYVGSANFSRSGLSDNLEAMLKASNVTDTALIHSYLDYLFSEEVSAALPLVQLPVLGTRKQKESVAPLGLQKLEKVAIPTATTLAFQVDLRRIVQHQRSSLNVYFGKGRLATSTGKVSARKWFEVEIIVPATERANPNYPRGPFKVITDDGYIMPMTTNGASNKNLRSQGNLTWLGEWIKGKLQRSGALIPLTLITEETLDIYGNDKISFYKTNGQHFLMSF